MKFINLSSIKAIVFILVFYFPIPFLIAQVTKVTLYPYMVTNTSNQGDAGKMVDEQELSGDPLNGIHGSPTTIWQSSYGIAYPVAAYIDLGSEMLLTNIFIYDSYNAANLVVDYGTPENWKYLFTESLNAFNKWKRHNINVKTRYIRISKTSPQVNFNELIIYAENPVLPPPSVTDLSALDPTPSSVRLTWTDPRGNKTTGNFIKYDLRYSKTSIDESNFNSALSFSIDFIPEPNKNQEVIVTGLQNGTKYYFALKLLGENSNSSISNITTSVTPVFYNQIESKLTLTPDKVVNESGLGNATYMFDEQMVAGDPLNGNGGSPSTYWMPGYQLTYYPTSAYIDLGSVVYISKIFLRDINSFGNATFEIGSPGNWTSVFTDPCLGYLTWNQHEVNAFSRYLRVTLATNEAKFTEIVVYAFSSEVVEQKIHLDPTEMNNISNDGESWKLVDEQDIAGDPLNSPGGNPTTLWQTSWNTNVSYPLFTELDLGKVYDLSHIFIRDSYDFSDFTVWSGYPGNWELLFTDNLSGYLSWNQHDVNSTTRYLRFGKSSPRACVTEVVAYGYDKSPGFVDSIPPAKITDLSAEITDKGEIELSWTAPGDDGMLGKADFYVIKYSIEPINESNFLTSLSWNLPPVPESSGVKQSIIIGGLFPDTKYYFAIESVDDAVNFSEISNIASLTTQINIGGDPYKFTLTTAMVINETVQGSASFLVDEQAVSGNPKIGQGGQPGNCWNLGSTLWMYPGYAIIDLGGNCLLSEMYLYDMSDAGKDSTSPVSVYYGTPFNWTLLLTDNLLGSDTWNQHSINKETRYLRVKIHSPETRVAEVIVYGSRLELPVEEPAAVVHPLPTIDQLIGINAFVSEPIGRIEVAGFVREYHNWMWCEGNGNPAYPGYPDNQNEFNTLGWNFDYFYANLHNCGITVCPDIQGNVPWLTNYDFNKLSDKPVSVEEDPLQPSSYAEHADHLFQFAARYGNDELSPELLKLAGNQEIVTGANDLKYYENWNEHDMWWKGRNAFFTPYEYSAMASADYDGHLGTMGATAGVKNADSNARLVMSGLAKPDINFVKAMKLWADYYRNGDLPIDVINVHHYCNNGNDQNSGTVGVSPEEGNLYGKMAEFVDFRNRYYPDKEVWITEFGYDTHPLSVQRAPQIGTLSQNEVQAQWLVRSYLVLAAAGVDKAAMYMLEDVDPNSATKFDNSGLISSKSTGYVPKTSWYYVYTMKNQLSGMHFENEIQSGNSKVMIYKFKNDNENVGAYAVWCPTSNQTSVSGYELTLAADESQVKLVELMEGSTTGQQTSLNVVNGKVMINVSERPVFVIAANDDYVFPTFKQEIKLTLNASMVTNESGLGNASSMADEQDVSGNPLMGVDGQPSTCWVPGWGLSYPFSSYIDLGQEYDVSKIYLYDLFSSGKATISTGEPGNWLPVCDDDLSRYGVWSGHAVNQTTRYIRVTVFAPTSCFAELVIYVRE